MLHFLTNHFYRKPALYFSLVLVLGALMIALLSPTAAQGPNQTAYILPANPQIPLGGFGTTDIWLEDIDKLSSFEFSLSYDQDVVRIMDINPNTSVLEILDPSSGAGVGTLFQGRQFYPGPALTGTGIITVSAALQGGQNPISGSGSLVSITWQGLQQTGGSAITLSNLQLFDKDGQLINPGQQNSSVQIIVYQVNPIVGKVNLQGRSSGFLNNTQIFLSSQTCPDDTVFPTQGLPAAAVTDSEGNFNIIPMPGQFPLCLQAVQPNYLAFQVDLSQGTTQINLNLLGGDIDNNNIVDLTDLIFISQNIGASNPDLRADINADLRVDIRDLTIASGNFYQSAQ